MAKETTPSPTAEPRRASACDRVCVSLARHLDASAVVLVVLGASHADGMSVCVDPDGGHAKVTMSGRDIAWLLRGLADKLETTMAAGQEKPS